MLKDLSSYQEIMEKCSHCSFCEAVCPVFQADLLETHVARARMNIIKAALLDETLPISPRVHEIINRCLLCSNCKQTCPSSVPVDEIVIAARHQLYNGKRLSLPKRLILKKIMEKRGVKGLIKKLNALAKTMNISPKEIPNIPRHSFADLYHGTCPPKGEIRAKAVYFVGCATNTIYPDTGDAVMKVMARNGVEIIIPEKIVCCGIPALVEGDVETATELMTKNIEILADLEADVILTDCTSCGLTLKEKMLKVFSQDHPLFEKAATIALKIRETMDYLNEIGLSETPPGLNKSFTYHIPCHSNWTQTMNDAPRELLPQIDEMNFIEMEESDKCCGAGGVFFTEFEELSNQIRSPKIKNIHNTGVNTIVTQCPSCRSYLKSALEDKNVIHPIALLARAYEQV